MTNPITDRAGGIGLEEQEQGGIPGQERASEAGHGSLPMPSTEAALPEVLALCDHLDAKEDECRALRQAADGLRAELRLAHQMREAAIDALRPFALLAEPIHPGWDDKRRAATLNIEPLQVRHLRRALVLVNLADGASSRPTPDASQVPGTHPDTEGQNT